MQWRLQHLQSPRWQRPLHQPCLHLQSPRWQRPWAQRQAVKQTYVQLVWRRFRRSRVSIVGGLMTFWLLPFWPSFRTSSRRPIPPDRPCSPTFTPPQRVRFVDENGAFRFRPLLHAALQL